MKFSILIAHYNNWEYFQACYQSILNQTYQDYEIIIIDDHSTDGSYEKLEELAKQNNKIRLFRNSENKKVGYTKRRCVEEAQGEVCGFLDPDDFITPIAIERVIKTYQLNKDCVATYSKLNFVDKNEKFIKVFPNTKAVKKFNKFFFNINFEIAHFFTFKKYYYNQTEGINSKLIISEDQDLYLKLYEHGEIVFINESLYNYRIHEKGISQNKQKTKEQNLNWHNVLLDTCKRRGIDKLYGKKVESIENLPRFIFDNENTFFKKLKRKLL